MGIASDIEADGDRCHNCGCLLWENFGGKHTRELLREWDGDIVFATMVDVTCGWCGAVNDIFYSADLLPPVSVPRRRRWAWAATV
jgi:ribosomal protein S27E